VGFLESFGCIVDLAQNGQEAIEMVAKNEYDLVFMDVQMPVMDGITATKYIREHETKHRVPIVAMTAHAMMKDRERCIAAGMDDHLAKPIRAKMLRTTLETHLRPKEL
jgi:CheY-like chemotaxis protein